MTDVPDNLSEAERLRYHRQLIFREWGEGGQQKIKNGTVFIAGVGGLGGPVSIYLAVAGVGRRRICDYGRVEITNLNRQILYTDDDIDKLKVDSAQRTLKKLNPHIRVDCFSDTIVKDNVDDIVGGADIVVDCLDNFETRFVLNEFVVRRRIPLVHAGVEGMAGQLSFIHPPETPCLRCKIPDAPPAAHTPFPIIGATAGILGCLEANEVLKYLAGVGSTLKGAILLWNGERTEFHRIEVGKDPDCPVCGKRHER